MISKNKLYNQSRHSVALEHKLSDKEIEVIDKCQFEFVKDKIQEDKSVRLPNFAIFLLKTRFENDGNNS